MRHRHRGWIHVAWAGWQMRVPSNWRPLDIRGDWKQGVMMLGDSQQPLLRVEWWHRKRKMFDPTRWARRRLRLSESQVASMKSAPGSTDFLCLAWVEGTDTGKRRAKSVWCGHAPHASLVLELVTGGNVPEEVSKRISRRVIPSLKASAKQKPTHWAIFDSSFEIPAQFRLRERRLALGDIALGFTARGGQRLVVRQVYPSQLALERRQMPRWLDASPFQEKRRFRPSGTVEAWITEAGGRTLEGYRRRGWKRFPFPLGRCAARWSAAVVVHDGDLDRLLLAEYDAPAEKDEALLHGVLGRMNWAAFERGAAA